MEREGLESAVDTSIDEHVFSGVVHIRREGNVVYERAAGYADRSNEIPNTLDTRFGIASGGKFFTALAIGKLVEAGELSFSTKLVDRIRMDLPGYSREVTIRHLLTHTSGIPDYYDEEAVDVEAFRVDVPWYDLRGPRDYLAVLPDEPMKFAPGERFSYCNSGYILLGVVIEELTGMRYQEFVGEQLFDPVGMTRSGYFAMNRLPENTAFGYVDEGDGWRTNVFDLPIVGASDGGAFSTVQDLATLWDAFWGYEVLSREMVETSVEPHVQVGEHQSYGHGVWIKDEHGGDREAYLQGYDPGVSFYSSRDLTVISNTTDGAWPVLRDIDASLQG